MNLSTRSARLKKARLGIALIGVVSLLSIAGAAVAPRANAGASQVRAAVPQTLLDAATSNKNGVFDVLVQSDPALRSNKLAELVARTFGKGPDAKALVRNEFSSVDAIEVNITGKDLLSLAKQKGIVSIVPNTQVTADAWDNTQHWDEADGTHWYWGSPYAKLGAPTIAVVDSGVSNANGAFGSRLLAQFDLGGGSASGDPRGHGTFVAALAAGAANGFAGTAPSANIVSLDVFDAHGNGTTASVIRAADWILQHKAQYNIRVANFSLQTSQVSSFMYDPLDQAVERLWEAGIVVVASAGNYANAGQPSGVSYAPGNDPFVITVGASDIMGTNDTKDDTNAPWSAYGYTPDGFAKPELGAPGRYLTELLPAGATLYADYPGNIVKPGQLQLSGTSFAAPLVSGMAAALLGAHPDWTPDQVKGALMLSAVAIPKAAPTSLGVGEANLQNAFRLTGTPPNPNAGIEQFLVPDPAGTPLPVFDGSAWINAASNNPSWNSASWSSASWSSASWSSASWTSDSTTDATNNARNDGVNLKY